MQLTTTYIDICSTPSSNMKININYKYTLLNRANLTPIRGKPTFKTLHKLRNKIKANSKAVYSNIGGGAHGHLVLVITAAQYALISPTPFVYSVHQGYIIILNSTTAHVNSNMRIAHTKEVCLFHEVTGVEETILQKHFGTVEEAYLSDIHNRTTNLINDTVTGVLTHMQDNYG